MITYFKMKRNEWKIKANLYGFILAVLEHQDELVSKLTELIQFETEHSEKGSD